MINLIIVNNEEQNTSQKERASLVMQSRGQPVYTKYLFLVCNIE